MSLRKARKTYRRSIKTSAEIHRLEKRIEWAIFWLIIAFICAMWVFVGWQFDVLEGMH